MAQLIKALCQVSSEGFSSYKEVKIWLEVLLNIKVKYDVVHHLVDNKLKAKLKVPRPVSVKQPKGAFLSFQKKTASRLGSINREG